MDYGDDVDCSTSRGGGAADDAPGRIKRRRFSSARIQPVSVDGRQKCIEEKVLDTDKEGYAK